MLRLMAEIDDIRLSDLDESHPETVKIVRNYLLTQARRFIRPHDPSLEEDLAHTALQKILKRKDIDEDSLAGVKNPGGYLLAVLRNLHLDRLRKDTSRWEELGEDIVDTTHDTVKGAETKIILSRVWKEFTGEERETLRLYIYGYSAVEMAKLLGIDVKDVYYRRVQLNWKIKKLRSSGKLPDR